MYNILRNIWPLFFGLFLIALSVGLQGSLIGIRASAEFDLTATGLVMTGYFIGFLIGSTQGANFIQKVGHVRTFGALTALASISIIIHAVFVVPWIWFVMRVITGIAMSGIYVVAESWLNHAATDRNRGQILSIYMMVIFMGLFFGQFLLNLADPNTFELFGLISILVSFAAIPILITVTPMPKVEITESVSIKKLFHWTSFGLIGVFLVNVCDAMIFGMAAVYGTDIGLSIVEISYFVASFILGGLILQWPIGHLSDKLDRRLVISVVAGAGTVFAYLCTLQSTDNFLQLLIFTSLLGGTILPLYALFIALINDYMRADKIVAASSTIVLVGGIGAASGPIVTALMMKHFGSEAFYWGVAVICAIISVYGAIRLLFFKYVREQDRHEFSIYACNAVGAVVLVEDDKGEEKK